MKKRFTGLKILSPKKRVALGFVGLMVFATGVLSLMAGRLHYSNYWGGAVFAPYAIIVGGMLMVGMILMRRR